MVEQIVYNITMVTLSIFWVATSYLGAKCDDEDSKNRPYFRQCAW